MDVNHSGRHVLRKIGMLAYLLICRVKHTYLICIFFLSIVKLEFPEVIFQRRHPFGTH